MGVAKWLRAAVGTVFSSALLLGSATPVSADSIRDQQWPLRTFGAEDIWNVSTGEGVTVAVIDSGVDGDHPDLKGNILPGRDFVRGGRGDRDKESEHGTSMAGLIAGVGHGPGNQDGIKGLAPEAKILPVTLGTQDGWGDSDAKPFPVKFPEAIRYAVDHGASVINMSFAYGSLSPEGESALDYAIQNDVVLVAGAGNDGTNLPSFPAAYPGVISVGAVDSSGEIWDRSSYGSKNLLSAPGVDYMAPSPNNQYRNSGGTSGATAYVSAAAALLRSKYPDLTAGQIANRLVKTATLPESAKDRKVPDPHYGYGFIRPYSALTEDIPAGPENGPLPMPSVSPSETAVASGEGDSSDTGSTAVVVAVVGGGLAVLAIVGAVVFAVTRRKSGGAPAQQPPVGGAYGAAAPHNPYSTTGPQPPAGHNGTSPPGSWG